MGFQLQTTEKGKGEICSNPKPYEHKEVETCESREIRLEKGAPENVESVESVCVRVCVCLY